MTIQNLMLLFAAIVSEVTATLSLRFAEGFTRIVPSIVVVAGYGVSFYLLSLLLKQQISIGIIYAIWSGLGTAGVVVAGALLWNEKLNVWSFAGIVLIIGGVVILNVLGGSAHQA